MFSNRLPHFFPLLVALASLSIVLADPTHVLAAEAAPQNAAVNKNGQPNILFIFLDDYGWKDCGFMGSDFYETPHIDQLASQGMVFTNAYATAANCAPSRACLLSGQYTPRHEIYNVGTGLRGNPAFSRLKHVPGTATLRPDISTWAHCLRESGYRTGTIGKWHLSDDPLPYGFDFNFAGTHSGSPPKGYFPPHSKAPGLEDSPQDQYLTDRLTDEAIEFIGRNQEQPWLLYLTHFAVHTPLQAKSELVAKYESKPKGELHNHAVMAAMIESVDEGIGRIVEELDQLKLSDNTVVIFTSDNGGYGPATSMSPLKGYKGTYYEGGIREPFFVKWPSVVEEGTTCETPIINVDIFPTLLEIAQVEFPASQPLDGQSLLPLLQQTDGFSDRALYWHFPAYLQGYSRIDQQRDPLFRTRPVGVIREGKWKLHEYFESGDLELYDLESDIGESNNISAANPKKAEQLREKMQAWRKRVNAPVPTKPNPQFDAELEAKQMRKVAGRRGNRN